MRHDEVKAKMEAEKQYINQANNLTPNAQQTVGMIGGCRPASPLEQAETDTNYHYERAEKCSRAAEFFRAHPEFDEFIQLIRSGVIGI